MNKGIEEERVMCETLTIRPIDETLASLNKPVIATAEDDIDVSSSVLMCWEASKVH